MRGFALAAALALANACTAHGSLALFTVAASGSCWADPLELELSGAQLGLADSNDFTAEAVSAIGDFDSDGTPDALIGASGSDDGGGANRGEAHILLMLANGGVKAQLELSPTTSGFEGVLADHDGFGSAVAALGDLDGDNVTDVLVGASARGSAGSAFVLLLTLNGSIKSYAEIGPSNVSDTNGATISALTAGARYGAAVASAGDLDGDGVVDVVIGAPRQADTGDSLWGALFVVTLRADGSGKSIVSIGASALPASVTAGAGSASGLRFGASIAPLGDLNNDGVPDLLVGAPGYQAAGSRPQGSVFVLFLAVSPNGTKVASAPRIGHKTGGLNAHLQGDDEVFPSPLATPTEDAEFGAAVANAGDLDGDGIVDVLVTNRNAYRSRGAIHVLYLRTDGTSRSDDLISSVNGRMLTRLDEDDRFGEALAVLGDVDGDGVPDALIGAPGRNGGVGSAILLGIPMTPSPLQTVSGLKIATGSSGYPSTLNPYQLFGYAAGPAGDRDGDRVNDVLVGSYGYPSVLEPASAAFTGAAHILLLHANGSVKEEAILTAGTAGIIQSLGGNDFFGASLTSIGDLVRKRIALFFLHSPCLACPRPCCTRVLLQRSPRCSRHVLSPNARNLCFARSRLSAGGSRCCARVCSNRITTASSILQSAHRAVTGRAAAARAAPSSSCSCPRQQRCAPQSSWATPTLGVQLSRTARRSARAWST